MQASHKRQNLLQLLDDRLSLRISLRRGVLMQYDLRRDNELERIFNGQVTFLTVEIMLNKVILECADELRS